MSNTPIPIAIIGAGPAGLMAAEVLSAAGICVHVYDAMPSVGRKFLLAGIGGLNLTHAEPFEVFTTRYGDRAATCTTWLQGFDASAIREWAKGLGIATFVGSSQRVFPTDMKAAPLLRAWLHRLRHPAQGEPVREPTETSNPQFAGANGATSICSARNQDCHAPSEPKRAQLPPPRANSTACACTDCTPWGVSNSNCHVGVLDVSVRVIFPFQRCRI